MKLFWIIYVFKTDENFKIMYKIVFHVCVPVATSLGRRIGMAKTKEI
jgi:hypothetical protein